VFFFINWGEGGWNLKEIPSFGSALIGKQNSFDKLQGLDM